MMIFLAATTVMALLGGELCGAASTGFQSLSKKSKFVIPITKVSPSRLLGSGHTDPLRWAHRSMYLGNITVGTPPQTVTVDFDTGSSLLWVLTDNHQVSCKLPDGSDRCYHYSKSHTHGRVTEGLDANYGPGEVWGSFVRDDVDVAGVKMNQLTVGVGNKLNNFFVEVMSSSRFSGSAGLSIGVFGGIVKHLNSSTIFEKNVFSMKLNSDSENYIMFGGWDENIVSEKDVQWNQVGHSSFVAALIGLWEFGVDGVSIGGTRVWGSDTTMVADTGCTISQLFPLLFDNIAKELGASANHDGIMVVPAGDEPKLKDITFKIGGRPHTLKPADYIMDKENGTLILGFQRYCDLFTGVSAILGDPFLKKYYTIYDYRNQQIAFASYKGKY